MGCGTSCQKPPTFTYYSSLPTEIRARIHKFYLAKLALRLKLELSLYHTGPGPKLVKIEKPEFPALCRVCHKVYRECQLICWDHVVLEVYSTIPSFKEGTMQSCLGQSVLDNIRHVHLLQRPFDFAYCSTLPSLRTLRLPDFEDLRLYRANPQFMPSTPFENRLAWLWHMLSYEIDTTSQHTEVKKYFWRCRVLGATRPEVPIFMKATPRIRVEGNVDRENEEEAENVSCPKLC